MFGFEVYVERVDNKVFGKRVGGGIKFLGGGDLVNFFFVLDMFLRIRERIWV